MDQNAINLNVQERLRALEAGLQVLVSFAAAVIETQPDRAKLRAQLSFHHETLHANRLNQPLAEDFLEAAEALHHVLDEAFARPIP